MSEILLRRSANARTGRELRRMKNVPRKFKLIARMNASVTRHRIALIHEFRGFLSEALQRYVV
jgi:hypothetical protein